MLCCVPVPVPGVQPSIKAQELPCASRDKFYAKSPSAIEGGRKAARASDSNRERELQKKKKKKEGRFVWATSSISLVRLSLRLAPRKKCKLQEGPRKVVWGQGFVVLLVHSTKQIDLLPSPSQVPPLPSPFEPFPCDGTFSVPD